MSRLLSFISPCVKFRFLVALGVLLVSGTPQAQVYVAGLGGSDWSTKSGSFACSLSHNIPGYGTAVFSRKAGGMELFELNQGKVVLPTGPVLIEAVPPSWRQDLLPTVLGQTQAQMGKTAIRLEANQILTLIPALEKGMQILFSAQTPSNNGTKVRVGLDAQKFAASYKAYKQCITQLIPYSFQQVSRAALNYDGKSEVLSPRAKAQLDKMILYAKADSNVLGIVVDAHSEKLIDPATADAISKQQADLVVAYLMDKGIAAEKITARWHGDKFPIASNFTAAGQAQNRRVTVRLENAETRKETEQKIADRKAAEEKLAANKAAEEKRQQQAAEQTPVLKRLVDLVEGQDLTSGKQPDLDKK